MTTHLTIRKALIDDVQNILPLLEQLGYPQTSEILRSRFEVFSKEGYGIFLAEKEETVVGLVAYSMSHLFVSLARRIHIEALIIDKKHRGSGIGKKLMNYIEDLAIGMSPCIIDLTSGLRREKDGSHDFYKSIGYRNEGHMAKLYLRKEIFSKN